MDHESLDEDAWIDEQRATIVDYLERQHLGNVNVGEYPAFHVHPYVSLWAVESKACPGSVGWWAISGDLPTDYITCPAYRHPRGALREFSRHWGEIADYMIRGEQHPDGNIGPEERWAELGALLKLRAASLAEMAADEELWCDEYYRDESPGFN